MRLEGTDGLPQGVVDEFVRGMVEGLEGQGGGFRARDPGTGDDGFEPDPGVGIVDGFPQNR